MKRSELLQFMRGEKHAVQASMNPGGPQAAVVGIVVSDDFEIFFDTLDTTRKAQNLARDPRIAFVIGGTGAKDERTVQYAGVVDEPSRANLARFKQIYFARFPDGPSREAWKGIKYFRVRPTWLRFSDFSQDPPLVVELTGSDLENLG